MFKKISKLLDLKLQIWTKELEQLAVQVNNIDKWNLETGKRFNEVINNYAISEEELLSISETVAIFVTLTRITNINRYLFQDDNLEVPRLPNTLK